MNAHLYDSDVDYENSMLTPEQRLVQKMDDSGGEYLGDEFTEWVLETKYEEIFNNPDWLMEFAKEYLNSFKE